MNDSRNTTDDKFLFSVIIPVYNTEDYLADAIDSVVGQTIGFKDNIQLILVNDGSTDGSWKICRQYQSRYPDNIIYIEKQNGGVSSARNAGLTYASGRYVNFLDSDDMWAENAFAEVEEFLITHSDIDIVSCRMLLLGWNEQERYHLDYEYNTTKVADVQNDYQYPLISVARAFIARELFKENSFDEGLGISEDLLLINQEILKVGRYGLLKEAVYYYRKREGSSSALDTRWTNRATYIHIVDKVYRRLIEYSKEIYGSVIPYIQYLIITDLQWRLRREIPEGVLSESEAAEYKESIRTLLQEIDDEFIVAQHHMSTWHKVYALKVKYGEESYRNQTDAIQRLLSSLTLKVNIFYIDDNEICIAGNAEEKTIDAGLRAIARDEDGESFAFNYETYPIYNKSGLFKEITLPGMIRSIRLPLKEGAVYSFFVENGTEELIRVKPDYKRYSRLTRLKNSYCMANGCIIRRQGQAIEIIRQTEDSEAASERKFIRTIEKKYDPDTAAFRKSVRAESHKRSRRPLWVIDGCSDTDGGNGDKLFDYLNSRIIKTVDARLIVDHTTNDHMRDNCNSNILQYGSYEHVKALTQADKVIITSMTGDIRFPEGNAEFICRDLMTYESIYIPEEDAAPGKAADLHYLKTFFDLILVNSHKKEMITNNNEFGYGKDHVAAIDANDTDYIKKVYKILKRR